MTYLYMNFLPYFYAKNHMLKFWNEILRRPVYQVGSFYVIIDNQGIAPMVIKV